MAFKYRLLLIKSGLMTDVTVFHKFCKQISQMFKYLDYVQSNLC